MEGARAPRSEELETCVRLLGAARAAAAQARGGPELLADVDHELGRPVTSRSALERWAAEPGNVLLAGTFEGVVVGVAMAHVPARASERIAVVDWLYVEPEARGVGVGTELANALLEWSTETGCRSLDVPALPGDRATKQLFESLGFSARRLLLQRRLRSRVACPDGDAAGEGGAEGP